MKEYLPNELITGIDKIDEQHGAMLFLLNKLEKYFKEGKGEKAISDSLSFLENYVKTHFKTEEEYMIKYHYPDYEVHKLEHEKFRKDFAMKRLKILRGVSKSESILLLKSLRDWYENHILKTDIVLASFLKSLEKH